MPVIYTHMTSVEITNDSYIWWEGEVLKSVCKKKTYPVVKITFENNLNCPSYVKHSMGGLKTLVIFNFIIQNNVSHIPGIYLKYNSMLHVIHKRKRLQVNSYN